MNKRTYNILLCIAIIGTFGLFFDYLNNGAFADLHSFAYRTWRNLEWWTNWYGLTLIVYAYKNIINKKHWSKHDRWYSSQAFFIYIVTISIVEFTFTWSFYTGLSIFGDSSIVNWDLDYQHRFPGSAVHIYNPILVFVLFRLEKFSIVDRKIFNNRTFYLLMIEPLAWVVWSTMRGFVVYANGNYESSLDLVPYAPFLDLFWIWNIDGYVSPPIFFRILWYMACLIVLYWLTFGLLNLTVTINNTHFTKNKIHK